MQFPAPSRGNKKASRSRQRSDLRTSLSDRRGAGRRRHTRGRARARMLPRQLHGDGVARSSRLRLEFGHFWTSAVRCNNPKGVASSSPGLRGTSYPGSESRRVLQPQRGCGSSFPHKNQMHVNGGKGLWHGSVLPQPRWGCQTFRRLPRVGARASRQPRAGGRNPVGVEDHAPRAQKCPNSRRSRSAGSNFIASRRFSPHAHRHSSIVRAKNPTSASARSLARIRPRGSKETRKRRTTHRNVSPTRFLLHDFKRRPSADQQHMLVERRQSLEKSVPQDLCPPDVVAAHVLLLQHHQPSPVM